MSEPTKPVPSPPLAAAPGSAHCGEQIESLSELIAARENRRAIICPSSHAFRGPMPAAWMANLSGEILHRLISQGMWVYVPNAPASATEAG